MHRYPSILLWSAAIVAAVQLAFGLAPIGDQAGATPGHGPAGVTLIRADGAAGAIPSDAVPPWLPLVGLPPVPEAPLAPEPPAPEPPAPEPAPAALPTAGPVALSARRPVPAPEAPPAADPAPSESAGAGDPRDPGQYSDPIVGTVISPFGWRDGRLHQGMDIKGRDRAPITASFPGRVIQAGWGDAGYGISVILDLGDGVTTLYGHLSSVTVSVGDVVAAGDQVGVQGQTGHATTPHLHYEIRIDGRAVNPAPYLG